MQWLHILYSGNYISAFQLLQEMENSIHAVRPKVWWLTTQDSAS